MYIHGGSNMHLRALRLQCVGSLLIEASLQAQEAVWHEYLEAIGTTVQAVDEART
jgi:hypothetical protein